jgi:hypothetical protein
VQSHLPVVCCDAPAPPAPALPPANAEASALAAERILYRTAHRMPAQAQAQAQVLELSPQSSTDPQKCRSGEPVDAQRSLQVRARVLALVWAFASLQMRVALPANSMVRYHSLQCLSQWAEWQLQRRQKWRSTVARKIERCVCRD